LDGTKKGIGIMQVNKKNADLGLHKYIQWIILGQLLFVVNYFCLFCNWDFLRQTWTDNFATQVFKGGNLFFAYPYCKVCSAQVVSLMYICTFLEVACGWMATFSCQLICHYVNCTAVRKKGVWKSCFLIRLNGVCLCRVIGGTLNSDIMYRTWKWRGYWVFFLIPY
jgi:hypothetical protein